MATHYNLIAGQSLERLAALSDGIFAVAMTLLVLDVRVPVNAAIHGDRALWDALTMLWPSLDAYLMSFLTLGIFWVGQQTQLNQFARSDRNLTWIHLAFLFAVTLMPFSTSLLAAYITYRLALVLYWLNIVLLGAVLFVSTRYAWHAGLVKADVTAEQRAANERRIVVAQALYAIGALLCVVSPAVSIAAIILVQLNYAIAPRLPVLYRL